MLLKIEMTYMEQGIVAIIIMGLIILVFLLHLLMGRIEERNKQKQLDDNVTTKGK